jgi:cystathionine beta-lyase
MLVAMDSFDTVIERRDTHSLKWTRYGREVLPMWVADMDFPAPEPARIALRRAVDHGVFGYELPGRKLMETVAARMQHLYGWAVTPEMVVAVPGIVAGFSAAARAACRAGEGILMQPPVYHPFLEVPEQAGCVRQFAPLRPTEEGPLVRYSVEWESFRDGLNSNNARTGMFLLCHPHNPTGQSYSRADLERMAELCLRNGTVICSDEIHSELLLGGARHVPLASLSPEIANRTITLVSPSKTFNLVGLFCGFAIIPDARLRARYRRVLQESVLHVNSLGLLAAEAAFSGACDAWLAELRSYLTGNRDYVLDLVSRELPGVRVTRPDATYLAWLDFREAIRAGQIPADPYEFFLKEAKVALVAGSEFGPGGEQFARLNFACPRATLAEGMSRIRNAVDSFTG